MKTRKELDNLTVLFLRVCVLTLLTTSVAKLSALFVGNQLLSELDPFLGLTFRNLLIVAVALEIIVCFVCLFAHVVTALRLVSWLSALFAVYRIGLWWTGWQKPCSCLGNLTDALHISPELADNVMKSLLAFMLIGSVSLLILHYRQGRVGTAAPEGPTVEPAQS